MVPLFLIILVLMGSFSFVVLDLLYGLSVSRVLRWLFIYYVICVLPWCVVHVFFSFYAPSAVIYLLLLLFVFYAFSHSDLCFRNCFRGSAHPFLGGFLLAVGNCGVMWFVGHRNLFSCRSLITLYAIRACLHSVR